MKSFLTLSICLGVSWAKYEITLISMIEIRMNVTIVSVFQSLDSICRLSVPLIDVFRPRDMSHVLEEFAPRHDKSNFSTSDSEQNR